MASSKECFVMHVLQVKEVKMVEVYCYSRCTTCKKAQKWLDDNQIEYTVIDIKEDYPDEKTLRSYIRRAGFHLKSFSIQAGSFIVKWNCQRSCRI